MARAASRVAHCALLVLVLLPGGTAELLPRVFGTSCTHACCRRTDACHRGPSSSAAHEPSAPLGETLHVSARHVLDEDCRELCGLLQQAASSTPGASAGRDPAPLSLHEGIPRAPLALLQTVELSVASPRGPPHPFSGS